MHFRSHEAPVSAPRVAPYRFTAWADRYEISSGGDIPPLRLTLVGHDRAFTLDIAQTTPISYPLEAQRGYESTGDLWSPGFFRVALTLDEPATLIASVESWETLLALTPEEAHRAERGRRGRLVSAARHVSRGDQGPDASRGETAQIEAELVLAADQFLIVPDGRVADAARAHAAGEEVRTVIAGYHWFTDWGRDTMISLEGLTLTTGRSAEAGYILRMFAHYVQDGLIPNMFPEGQKQGLYHTADATLWFFHAIDRYVETTNDRATLHALTLRLIDIVDHHLKGTRFGIGVDTRDGLLRQGAEGYQLTWMDAKVGDWVVTPRRGKAVEINALWYNALKLMEGWVGETRGAAAALPYARHAEAARQSFNARFWYDEGGYLYDVVDGVNGDDPACRPNQLFAVSLRHPVLDPARWEAVVEVVAQAVADPRRPPLARPRSPRLQGPLLRRPTRPRRGLSPRHCLGLAHRPVHRRLAEGPPQRPRRRPPLSRRFCAPPQRGGPRDHQRDLRRRATVYPAWLHCPGLERRRGAPLLDENLGLSQTWSRGSNGGLPG